MLGTQLYVSGVVHIVVSCDVELYYITKSQYLNCVLLLYWNSILLLSPKWLQETQKYASLYIAWKLIGLQI